MKSLNFRRKETGQLRYLEERVMGRKSKSFNWDRAVYLTILGLIVFFVLRYFYFNNFYITANGQVLFENFQVTSTEDIRIEKFYRAEGDNVNTGDTLFTYVIEDQFMGMGEEIVENPAEGSGSTWAEREIYSLQKNIDLNTSKIRGDRQLLESYRQQYSQLENEVILGAASERDLNNLEYQISKLETAINLARSENAVLLKQLNALRQRENQLENNDSTLAVVPVSPYRAFLAPIDGYVARIFKDPYEVALKSQVVLNIHQADSVHVKGYFDQEDLKYVKEGDKVSVSFPDGAESEGVINRFYSSTVLIPEEFQKRFEPAKRTIAVDILPAQGSDLSIWKRYYKLSVKLTKRTF